MGTRKEMTPITPRSASPPGAEVAPLAPHQVQTPPETEYPLLGDGLPKVYEWDGPFFSTTLSHPTPIDKGLYGRLLSHHWMEVSGPSCCRLLLILLLSCLWMEALAAHLVIKPWIMKWKEAYQGTDSIELNAGTQFKGCLPGGCQGFSWMPPLW